MSNQFDPLIYENPQDNMNIIERVDAILQEAINKKASDIHFEPYKSEYRIRIRIDGVLNCVQTLSSSIARQMNTRLKILAKLNIAEFNLPQDGQLKFEQHTMRVSTIPVTYGEKVVLRLMDNENKLFGVDELGLSSHALHCYKKSLNAPQGLILVTGPTGSGKTVTLYSGISLINSLDKNISTVEDQIELPIESINQTQINTKMNVHFETMLRALLRQDPDVIMIGEIRDKETAEIAIQAAQTGHLVLSTLHTNSSAETITRLSQMGLKHHFIASSLLLIIAQRLVRKLCPNCRIEQYEQIVINNDIVIKKHWKSSFVGCELCSQGYRGRIALYEFLPMNH